MVALSRVNGQVQLQTRECHRSASPASRQVGSGRVDGRVLAAASGPATSSKTGPPPLCVVCCADKGAVFTAELLIPATPSTKSRCCRRSSRRRPRRGSRGQNAAEGTSAAWARNDKSRWLETNRRGRHEDKRSSAARSDPAQGSRDYLQEFGRQKFLKAVRRAQKWNARQF